MDPNRGAGDPGRHPVRGGGDAADHAPDERALSLPIGPGMKVIGDEDGVHARFLGQLGLRDQRGRTVFLTREKCSDSGHPNLLQSVVLRSRVVLLSRVSTVANSRGCVEARSVACQCLARYFSSFYRTPHEFRFCESASWV